MEELAEKIKMSPGLQDETQSWLAIADISKEELKGENLKTMLKGCTLRVIGGRHRQAAYEKVSVIPEVLFCLTMYNT